METVKYSGKRNVTVMTGWTTPVDILTDEELEALYSSEEMQDCQKQAPELFPATLEEYRKQYRKVAIIIDGEKIVGALAMPEGESLWAFSKSREFTEAMRRYA